jgi:hypothetical protein
MPNRDKPVLNPSGSVQILSADERNCSAAQAAAAPLERRRRQRRRRQRRTAGGCPLGGAPDDDTEGFARALLSPPQLAALLALPCVEIKRLLDAAGDQGYLTLPVSLTRTCAAVAAAVSMARAAAPALSSQESAFGAAAAATVDEARRQ